MSWLRKPGSRVLHVPDSGAPGVHGFCPVTFPDPHLTSYWVWDRTEGERVCGHCARAARRRALALLAAAEGRSITDAVARRSKRGSA